MPIKSSWLDQKDSLVKKFSGFVSKQTHPNLYRGHQYALKVLQGKLHVGEEVVGACLRYLIDLDVGKYRFDKDKAERFLRLVQKFKHIKGVWDNPYLVFEPWQCFIFLNLYGFINPVTGYRRFRNAYIEVARGNGKSAMISTTCLYELALDNPVGNEISCFASKGDQARIVLDSSRAMAKGNNSFLEKTGVRVLSHVIKHEKSNSIMRHRSSDHGSTDGLNDKLSVIDEAHAVDRELYDVIVSGAKKRRDSLVLIISTAGFNVDSIGFELSNYTKKICSGEHEDDTHFGIVYCLSPDDDITDPKNWQKANPNFGVSVDPIGFEAAVKKALVTPSDLPNVKVKHFNLWISEMRAYYDMRLWDRCGVDGLKIEDFIGMKGARVIGALDMAIKVDLCSLGYVIEKDGIYYVFDDSFIPEETVRDKRSVLYDDAIARGFLHATKGAVVDYDIIKDKIKERTRQLRIQQWNYDPWSASEVGITLNKERINMVEFRMTTANLSEPTKKLDELMRSGKLKHNNSPLLRWAISNIVAKEDANSNVFPRKSEERLKIDPALAIIMGLASAIQKDSNSSVYEARPIRSL